MSSVFDNTETDRRWDIIKSYFNENRIVDFLLDSYNNFMRNGIQQVIDDVPDFEAERKKEGKITEIVKIHFGQIYFGELRGGELGHILSPNEARLRNLTYARPLYVDITQTITCDNKVDEREFKRVYIGEIPVMIQSEYCSLYNMTSEELSKHGECSYDIGGYFIINGNEKVVVAHENIATENIYIFESPSSKTKKYSYKAEIRSIISKIEIVNLIKTNTIGIVFPGIKPDVIIPVCVIFKALGVCNDKNILEHIVSDFSTSESKKMIDYMVASLEEAFVIDMKANEGKKGEFSVQSVALEFIGRNSIIVANGRKGQIEHAKKLINDEIFPHMGISESHFKNKAYFLGYMLYKLLRVLIEPLKEERTKLLSDRDHYGNKKLDVVGELMTALFRKVYRSRFIHKTHELLIKLCETNKDIVITTIIKSQEITSGMKYSLATGNWGLQKQYNAKSGVSQILNRLNYVSYLSHLHRITIHTNKDSKLQKPRLLNSSSFGFICPTETPEGANCGLVKNLALMTYISVEKTPCIVQEYIKPYIDSDLSHRGIKVFLNGIWLGVIPDKGWDFVRRFRKMKRCGEISFDTSIYYHHHHNEIKIHTDSGRAMRPLLVVKEVILKKKGKEIGRRRRLAIKKENLKDSWTSLVENGYIEYLSANEQEMEMIAYTEDDLSNNQNFKYTYCEIHPSLILGVSASIIPFANHNPGPRNSYQSGMVKQAMGMSSTNPSNFGTQLILHYPQKPLVHTKYEEFMKIDELPYGMNAIVAICSYTGYNQEDSIIINKSSLDRGFARITKTKIFSEIEKMGEQIEIPKLNEMDRKSLKGNIAHLEEDGIVGVGTRIKKGDVLVGKTVCLEGCLEGCDEKIKKDDLSLVYNDLEEGTIDSVIMTTNEDGHKMIVIKIRFQKIPELGDKFSARSAQKGTNGMIYRQEDMPFTKDGIVPDIIFNPHGIPSRMTLSYLLELVYGKVGAMMGKFMDATVFDKRDVNGITEALKKMGLQPQGEEVLYNGFTGKRMKTTVCMGPVCYQRLKHMVSDKIHCLTMDHEVLTDSGWKQPEQLRMVDKIASLNNGKLVYEKPTKLMFYPNYEGSIYSIKNQNVDLKVTGNHRMWVSKQNKNEWKFERADQIVGKHRQYKNDVVWIRDDYQLENIFRPNMNVFLIFFGIWFNGGRTYIYRDPESEMEIQSIVQISTNKHNHSMVIDVVREMGYTYLYDDGDILINDIQLYNYMKQFDKKSMPEWVWNLSSKQCKILIDHMIFSDNYKFYYTTSTRLRDDFQRLCLHAGYVSVYSKQKVEGWRIDILTNNPSVNLQSEIYSETYEKNVKVPVFCLQVPSGVFYVRRGGKSVWTGNSRGKGPVEIMTRQPVEGRSRGGGLRLGEMERDNILGQGMYRFVIERLFTQSDDYSVYVCKRCGFIVYKNVNTGKKRCKHCGIRSPRDEPDNEGEIVRCAMPYVCKLFFQELGALGIHPRITVSDKEI